MVRKGAGQPERTELVSVLTLLLMAAVITFGGVLLWHAPLFSGRDPNVLPRMAERAVRLQDGTHIYVQKYEVTVSEWNRCFAAGACSLELHVRPGWSADSQPATGVNYIDVSQYLDWMNRVSGHKFRLPTKKEWEYMAAEVMPEKPDPIFTDPSLRWASAYLMENIPGRALKPVGSFPETNEGIGDLSGSVWEWTKECYKSADDGVPHNMCPAFYVGGEHTAVIPFLVRDPARGGCAVGAPPAHLGLRLVTDYAVPS